MGLKVHSFPFSLRALLGRSLLLFVAFCFAAATLAQQPPLGGEFQANTQTAGEQRDPKIAPLAGGGFVVVWSGYGGDGSQTGVVGQRFDGLGEKVGGEFLVNTYTTNIQRDPAVAGDGKGNFVVVWETFTTPLDGDHSAVLGQRFDGSGTKVGPEFLANTYTTGYQFQPTVAMNEAGAFVVVWNSPGQDLSGFGLFGQKFSNAGAKVGSEFPVNTNTLGHQNEPAVGLDRAGNFVVAWTSSDLYGKGVFFQRFNASGAKLGPELPAHFPHPGDQDDPAIGVQPAGDFLVLWESTQPAGAKIDVFGQRFNSAGEKVAGEFRINADTAGYQLGPSVAVDRSGRFVVTWDTFPDDRSSYAVAGLILNRKAERISPEFPFSLTNRGDINHVAATGVGPAAVWMHDDGSVDGITGRRQEFSPAEIHVDEASRAGTFSESDLNGVLEPGENAMAETLWVNNSSSNADLTGSSPLVFCILGTPCVGVSDRNASYGVLLPGTIATCNDGSSSACYTAGAGGPRPATHWDGGFSENLSVGGGQFWTLHVGDSFSDVPRSQIFYKKIETMLHHGITSGCSATEYCPETAVPRDQMAIFIAKAVAGAGDLLPQAGSVEGRPYNCTAGGTSSFTDVDPGDLACRHVHYLAARNVTLGCSPTQFCPSPTVTREAMASFIAKAIVAPAGGNGVPATYGPDPSTGRSYSCAGGSPSLHFSDVPVSNAFCKHIHFLWAKGFVDGCSPGQYCPGQLVTRGAMAKFIGNAFDLKLYAP